MVKKYFWLQYVVCEESINSNLNKKKLHSEGLLHMYGHCAIYIISYNTTIRTIPFNSNHMFYKRLHSSKLNNINFSANLLLGDIH